MTYPGTLPDTRGSVRTPAATADAWSPADIAAAAFHMQVIGMTEQVAAIALRTLAARGVRNLRAYVQPWSEQDGVQWAAEVDRVSREAARAASAAAGFSAFRDPLIRGLRRRAAQWPWGVPGSPSWRVNS